MALTRVRAEQILDIDFKQAVRVLSNTNVTNLSTSAPSVVDSVALSLNDRILVSGQDNQADNGLYYVAYVGSGSDGEWLRTQDGNVTGEINAGMIVMVTEGYLYADTLWKLITDNPINIGFTALEFVLNSQASFDVINANGTPVSANTISSTINYLPGNNMVINGLDIDDSITFAVNDAPNFAGNITGQGNLFISRDVSITGNLTIGANLNVVNVNEYVGATGNISFLGNLLPGTSNVQNYSLGLPGQPWTDVYVANLNVAVYSIDNLEVTTDATILGNLTVLGTTTTINSNVIVTNDLNIDLANNQSTFGNVNGAGLLVGNTGNAAVLTWQYNYVANSWTTNVGITAVGNVSGNYIYGNGAFLTDINAGNIVNAYGNANVAEYLPTYTGNITAGNISVTGNITANYYSGNGVQLTGIATATDLANTNSNVSNVVLDIANTNSNVSNVSSNVSNLSNSLSNTNSNVSNVVLDIANTNSNVSNTNSNVANLTTALSNTNSNISNIVLDIANTNSNVSNLTTSLGNTNSNVSNLSNALANTNSNVTTLSNTVANNSSNITTLQGQVYANANVAAYLPTYSGNITAGNLSVAGNIIGNITFDNVITGGTVSASGNIEGNYFIGNGSQLTGIVTFTDLSNTNSNVSNLSNSLSNTNSNVSNLTTSLGNTNSNVSNLSNSLGNTNSNVSNLILDLANTNSNVSNTNSNVNNLTTSLGNTNANVSNVASNVTTLQGQVYTNSNVAAYLPTYTGNLIADVISATGNITGNVFIGNGSQLTGISVASVSGTAATVTTNAQPNITSVGTLTTLTVTGNITGNVFIGNGSQLTGIVSTTDLANTNSNVSNLTTSLGNTNSNVSNLSNSLSNTNSNVSNVASNVTSLQGQVYANANVAAYLPTYTGDITANIVSTTGNVTTAGWLISANSISVAGTLSIANGNLFVNGLGNVQAGNLLTNGRVSAAGNITGAYLLGNGSQLTGLPIQPGTYSNSNVANYLPTYSGNITADNVSITGNITGNYIFGNGSQLTGLPATYGNTEVAAYLPTYAGNLAGNNLSVTNTANVGTLYASSGASVTGTMTATYANAQFVNQTNGAGWFSAAGNIYGNNSFSVVGNIAGNVFIGNGSQLTGIATATDLNNTNSNVSNLSNSLSNTNSNVSNLTISIGNTNSNVSNLSNSLSTTNSNVSNTNSNVANLTTALSNTNSNISNIVLDLANTNSNVSNLTTALSNTNSNVSNVASNVTTLQGQVYANANVAAYLPTYSGNITADIISATGNITGNVIFGNGSQLTGLVSVSGTAATVTTNAQPNITSVGTLTTLTVTGNTQSGNLLTTGNLSASGNVSISNVTINSLTYVPQLWFKGTLSSDITPTINTDNFINWTTVSDPGNWYTSGDQRITPGRIGWYEVVYKLSINANGNAAAGQLNTQIRVNNVSQGFAQMTQNQAQTNGFTLVNPTMLYLSNTTDYIQTTVYPTTSGQTIGSGVVGSQVYVRWIST